MSEELELKIGDKIKLGKKYVRNRSGFKEGQIIELVEGFFDEDNGLYCYTSSAPSIWNEQQREYDSIYHLFGNDLEDFEDCELIQ